MPSSPLPSPDSTGSLNGVDVLKVYCSEPHLIMQLKFSKEENCRRFLQSYREGALQDSLQKHLKNTLSMASVVPVETELKAGAEKLDSMIREEDRCLECIYHEKVTFKVQAWVGGNSIQNPGHTRVEKLKSSV